MKENNVGCPTWIWFPGDMEVWLGNCFNNRRSERGAIFPPFWKQDSHWPTVLFSKTVCLEKPQTITIATEGLFSLMVDGKLQGCMASQYTIPQGKHQLEVKVWNQATPPALFIEGETIVSNSTWLCTYEDKIWIDENGVAHGAGIYVPVGFWSFYSIHERPSEYHLHTIRKQPNELKQTTNGMLYDFGCETFGYIILEQVSGAGRIYVYYGESREEAMDKAFCETLDYVDVAAISNDKQSANYRLSSKAFRYVYIETTGSVQISNVCMDFEFAESTIQERGTFECDDELINRIWKVSAYTLDLTTREFFMDGIKRDRWVWSGDAIQSYQMNYYHRFDSECVKRTIRQLRGKDPVTSHINTIMDYTFYWFKSIEDYYLYTGDKCFIREIYPKMLTLMDYCLGRTNEDGMAEGQPDDWIFVDWVDFPMHKRGTLCFEQLLFCKALESLALCAELCEDKVSAKKYGDMSVELLQKTRKMFWSEKYHAFTHSIEKGIPNEMITKFPNMFAIIYGYTNPQETMAISEHVMLSKDIEKITTPYMRYYELESLCMIGLQEKVLDEIRGYWGGMLEEGATTFWEKFIPEENGTQHLAMYGRPYGKSLCHAWGASPLYLIGRYFLGVCPTKPGYKEFEIHPELGGLQWMKGVVPTPNGEIQVSVDSQHIRIKATEGQGFLYFHSVEMPQSNVGKPEALGDKSYRLWIETDTDVEVRIN